MNAWLRGHLPATPSEFSAGGFSPRQGLGSNDGWLGARTVRPLTTGLSGVDEPPKVCYFVNEVVRLPLVFIRKGESREVRALDVRRFGAGAALVVCAFLFPGGAASSAPRLTLYVDGSTAWCSDSNGSGSKTKPFCTIGAAAAKASAGVTVKVAGGIYRERVVVGASGTAANPIVFSPVRGATVVITGGKNGFSIDGGSWIHINGFTVTHTGEYGISVSHASNVTISRNRVRYAGQPTSGRAKYGIRLRDVRGSLVFGNTVDHNSSSGIALVDGSTHNEIASNRSFDNARLFERAASGIRLYASPANTITRNVVRDNEDSGIELVRSDDNVVCNNVSYSNRDHGIDVTGVSRGTRVLANTIYGNVTAGINVEGGSTGATVANNISVQNGVNSPRTASNIRVDAASVSGTSMNYDLVHGGHGDREVLLIWNSVGYRSLAEFRLLTGQERHGVDVAPRWKDAAAGNFNLTARSRAIDSATSAVRRQPAADINGTRRTDDPATPNTGIGPRLYDDRGAFEYRRPRRR
jgi:parallel beta-helix repeat protein